MVDFIKSIKEGTLDDMHEKLLDTSSWKPFMDGLDLEQSYRIHVPCYSANLVNPDKPKECVKGSKWVPTASVTMGGSTADEQVTLNTFDNFHRQQTTEPHHLPQVNNSCPENGPKPCVLQGLTVSENYYTKFDDLPDTGFFMQAAYEIKSKMLSRQKVQYAAGHTDADF